MRIQFEFGSAKLTDSAKKVLNELGAALQSDQLAAYQFSLVGHTDAVGSDAANLKLSQARAASVKDYLIGQFHIDAARLEASGVGESRSCRSERSEQWHQPPRGDHEHRLVTSAVVDLGERSRASLTQGRSAPVGLATSVGGSPAVASSTSRTFSASCFFL